MAFSGEPGRIDVCGLNPCKGINYGICETRLINLSKTLKRMGFKTFFKNIFN